MFIDFIKPYITTLAPICLLIIIFIIYLIKLFYVKKNNFLINNFGLLQFIITSISIMFSTDSFIEDKLKTSLSDLNIYESNIKFIFYNYKYITESNFNYNENINFFGQTLVILASIIGALSTLTIDSRLNIGKINFLVIFLYFDLTIWFFIKSENFIEFFIYYEFLLLPSFLIVYLLGYSRRTINSSIYFLIWTQIGSLVVLVSILILKFILNIDNFVLSEYYIKSQNSSIYYIICATGILLGFGVKIPFWPFHYWITKTHVESPSGFSIYLSGFLVKTAIFGIYKFLPLINYNINLYPFLLFILIGFLDSSVKFFTQTDIKKLIAYCTIQEMNFITFIFLFTSIDNFNIGVLFVTTHGLLSSLLFFIIDCIYRRLYTRSIIKSQGLLSNCSNISISIILTQLVYIGLPGSAKFIIELNFITSFIITYTLTILYFIIINLVSIFGFSKNIFNLIFGNNCNIQINKIFDLTYLENTIIYLLIFSQFFISFYFII